jgi:hypothetical protein
MNERGQLFDIIEFVSSEEESSKIGVNNNKME